MSGHPRRSNGTAEHAEPRPVDGVRDGRDRTGLIRNQYWRWKELGRADVSELKSGAGQRWQVAFLENDAVVPLVSRYDEGKGEDTHFLLAGYAAP